MLPFFCFFRSFFLSFLLGGQAFFFFWFSKKISLLTPHFLCSAIKMSADRSYWPRGISRHHPHQWNPAQQTNMGPDPANLALDPVVREALKQGACKMFGFRQQNLPDGVRQRLIDHATVLCQDKHGNQGVNPAYITDPPDHPDGPGALAKADYIIVSGIPQLDFICGFALVEHRRSDNLLYVDVICALSGVKMKIPGTQDPIGVGTQLWKEIEKLAVSLDHHKSPIHMIKLCALKNVRNYYRHIGFSHQANQCDHCPCVYNKHTRLFDCPGPDQRPRKGECDAGGVRMTRCRRSCHH